MRAAEPVISILIVSHGNIARELLNAAVAIHGPEQNLDAVGIDWSAGAGTAGDEVRHAIDRIGESGDILILTDMFGGTPSNLALSLLERDRIEIVTGVNLPMVLRSLAARPALRLHELARDVRQKGRRSIEVASELLAEPQNAVTGEAP